jgi:hypothetical protein
MDLGVTWIGWMAWSPRPQSKGTTETWGIGNVAESMVMTIGAAPESDPAPAPECRCSAAPIS